MKKAKTPLFLSACIALFLVGVKLTELQVDPNTVTRIVDGDTIELADGRKVRYIGVDTPEKKTNFTTKECFSEQASAANKEFVLGKTVTLEKDVSETDRYDRLLRFVYVDGELVQEKLIKGGFAEAKKYKPDVSKSVLFEQWEQDARKQKVGMWGEACAAPAKQ